MNALAPMEPDPWPAAVLAAVRDQRMADAGPLAVDLARGVLRLFGPAEGMTREVDQILRGARAILAVAGVRP